MIIEAIILAALAIAQITAAVYVVFLVFSEIANWFTSHRKLSANDHREVGFTLQERLATGEYKTVQGVFNKSTNTLGDVRAVRSSHIDDRLASYHVDTDLVVYD